VGRNLQTVAQLAKGSLYTEAQCRWWIFNAERNGLAPAIERAGNRVLIDAEKFADWRRRKDAERHQGGDA